MPDQESNVHSNPTDLGLRRFLMGAAGLAAAPLVAGMAAGCTSNEQTPESRATGTSGSCDSANR
jgi:hypothetical protein